MLAYLDALCDAMAARDEPRLRDLVHDHPLVRLLPPDALAEVRRFLAGRTSAHTVPMVMLRFRDQTARLLNELPRSEAPTAEGPAIAPAPRSRRPAPTGRRGRRGANQMELPLSA